MGVPIRLVQHLCRVYIRWKQIIEKFHVQWLQPYHETELHPDPSMKQNFTQTQFSVREIVEKRS